MKYFLRVFLFFISLGCQRPEQPSLHQVTIQIPSVQEFLSGPQDSSKAKIKSFETTVPYERLCFAVNAKGSKINSDPPRACTIEKGIIVGAVAPGDKLTMTLNTRQTVTFELYGFLRNSSQEQCPAVASGDWTWPIRKTYALGVVPNQVIEGPETLVEFQVNLPSIEHHIGVQNSWPLVCQPSPLPAGAILSSAGVLSGSRHQLYLKSNSISSVKPLKGQRFQIKGWVPR